MSEDSSHLDSSDPTLKLRSESIEGGWEMNLELTDRIHPELQTYPLYRIDDAQARAFYDWHKWWAAHRIPPPEELERMLSVYASAMERPYLAPVGRRLVAFAQARPPGMPITVVELGGANAALLRWWPQNMPNVPLKYIGIEPFKPYVEYVRSHFPEAQVAHGDAEAFLGLDFARLKPVTAFVAATVFCFVHPDTVRRCIVKAAEWTDDLLIRDFALNIQGTLVPAGQGHLTFDYFSRSDFPTLFAHRFEDYFREVGFAVVHMEETRTDVDFPGWALIHARRRQPADLVDAMRRARAPG